MKKLSNLYLAFVFIVLYLPIFYLIGYAFNAGDDMNSFTGFSWTHFETMFGDGRLMLILVQTFLLAFLSALIATVIELSVPFTFINHVKNTKKPFYLSITF